MLSKKKEIAFLKKQVEDLTSQVYPMVCDGVRVTRLRLRDYKTLTEMDEDFRELFKRLIYKCPDEGRKAGLVFDTSSGLFCFDSIVSEVQDGLEVIVKFKAIDIMDFLDIRCCSVTWGDKIVLEIPEMVGMVVGAGDTLKIRYTIK
jgi:hypothetical protein